MTRRDTTDIYPGQWSVTDSLDSTNHRRVSIMGVAACLAKMQSVGVDGLSEKEILAAAHLMKAAPDLLRALQNAAEFLQFYFAGRDAEQHREWEGIKNMKYEADFIFNMSVEAIKFSEPPEPDVESDIPY